MNEDDYEVMTWPVKWYGSREHETEFANSPEVEQMKGNTKFATILPKPFSAIMAPPTRDANGMELSTDSENQIGENQPASTSHPTLGARPKIHTVKGVLGREEQANRNEARRSALKIRDDSSSRSQTSSASTSTEPSMKRHKPQEGTSQRTSTHAREREAQRHSGPQGSSSSNGHGRHPVTPVYTGIGKAPATQSARADDRNSNQRSNRFHKTRTYGYWEVYTPGQVSNWSEGIEIVGSELIFSYEVGILVNLKLGEMTE